MLAPDRFGMLLGVGIVSMIIVQALINIGGGYRIAAYYRDSLATY